MNSLLARKLQKGVLKDSYRRLTQRAQMKWEVKGGEAVGNKKTNQTERSSARLLWGCCDYSVIWLLPKGTKQQKTLARARMCAALGEVV
jgi:hypothetical protein